MSWASSILIRPTAVLSPFRFRNPNSFFALRLGLPKKFYRNTVVFWNSITRNAMSDTVTDTFRVEDEDGVLHTQLEQEALINGSSQIVGFSQLETTLNNMSKWLVVALFGAILLWRHDAESLWAAMGSVINSALSTVLKRMLNEKRPSSTLRSDPGMPSSHAQSIFFTATFSVISMVQCFGLNGWTEALCGLIFALASYFSWLRISQKLHTISQVLVGASLGFCFSALWFWSWDAIVMKAFISSMLVRIIVLLGAAGFCVGFLIHVIRHIELARGLNTSCKIHDDSRTGSLVLA